MEPNVSTIPMAMSASAPQVSNLNAERCGQRNVSVLSFVL